MSNETIVVVEDALLVGLEIKEDLENLGYVVPEVAVSSEAAMAAVARHKPALVIMDVRIQGAVDGIDTAFLLKAEFDVPVLFLTAYSDSATLQRAAATGPDAYLLKPFDERELAANVAMILAKASKGGSLKASLRGSIPLADALEQPSLLVDLDGIIVHGNAKATELLGAGEKLRLRGEALGRFLSEPQAADPGMPSKDLLLKALDGSPLGMSSRIEPVIREDGIQIGNLVTFDRMTCLERDHLETSVAEINKTLVDLVPGEAALGPGFRIEGFLLPCHSGAGDILDAFRLGPHTAAFHGIDVMGHGSLASLVAYSLHSMVRDLARQQGREGAFGSATALVKSLNERYSRGPTQTPFFTMTYGIVDNDTGDFLLARAGHPPALLVRASGSCEILQPQGGALGVIDNLEVDEVSGRLGRGDRLVLISDGYLEASFGLDIGESLRQLKAELERMKALDLGAFVAALRREVEGGGGESSLRDDASLLVVERTT